MRKDPMSIDSFHTSGHSPGPDFDRPTAFFSTASRCRVGLLGFGTVGSAVARRLAPNFTIAKFRAEAVSDNPVYLAQREHFYKGLQLAGVPED